jgi:hypothetical protein
MGSSPSKEIVDRNQILDGRTHRPRTRKCKQHAAPLSNVPAAKQSRRTRDGKKPSLWRNSKGNHEFRLTQPIRLGG